LIKFHCINWSTKANDFFKRSECCVGWWAFHHGGRGGGKSSGKSGDKSKVGKPNDKGERKAEGKVDKGKGRDREAKVAEVESGEGEEVDGEEEVEVGRRLKMSAAHDYRRQVTEALIYQLRLWRPEAVHKRKGGTMPYKHLPKFAFDNQVRLFGWPVGSIPQFPGEPSFDVDKVRKGEWQHLWQAGVVDKTMGIEPWSASMSEFHLHSESAWC
jgi:hypothetical protein